jgi:hypothetical protein
VIEHDLGYRPRVSRETRRLLIAALSAVVAIWVLARIRFPDEPSTPNPVAPLLSQLTPRYRFADLAIDVGAAQGRIGDALEPFGSSARAVLRLPNGVGLVLAASAEPGGPEIARDPVTGLALVRLTTDSPFTQPPAWAGERLDQPRYLLAASASASRILTTPVLINTLEEVTHPFWTDPVWMVRGEQQPSNGSFVFTGEGHLVGLFVQTDHLNAIVPAPVLMAQAARLREVSTRGTHAELGIEVADLTPAVARATRSAAGVVVSYVDAAGPAARSLVIGDVIEAVDGAPVRGRADWRARTGRLALGEGVMLNVRRSGEPLEIALAGAAATGPPASATLGLELRRIASGAEVVGVDPSSAAFDADVRAGDVIVQIGSRRAPSPAAVRQAFAALASGGAVVVGIARGQTHLVTALEKDAASVR